MTRLTRRGAALIAVTGGTYVAARILGTWELYLITLAFAAMIGVAWVVVSTGTRRLTIERTVTPERAVAGDPLEFAFRAHGGPAFPGLHTVLTGATGTLGTAEPVEIEGLGGGAARKFVAGPWPARRGVHRLPAFFAVAEDPLGLVRARRRVGEPLQVTVAPRLEELASCAACTDSGVLHGGGRRPLPTRDASEFHAIRPHTPGEPLNRVDWKSTAKTGSLMLREMEAATEDDLTVLLSGAASQTAGDGPDAAFETAVTVAGSMAAFTLRTGHSVTLLLPEREWRPLHFVPDAAGRLLLLGALAEAEPPQPTRLGPSLQTVVAGHRRQTRRQVLALVVLRLDPGLVGAVVRLREQGVALSVTHVVDQGAATDADLGRALTAGGVRYTLLHPGDDLREALAADPAIRRSRVRAR